MLTKSTATATSLTRAPTTHAPEDADMSRVSSSRKSMFSMGSDKVPTSILFKIQNALEVFCPALLGWRLCFWTLLEASMHAWNWV